MTSFYSDYLSWLVSGHSFHQSVILFWFLYAFLVDSLWFSTKLNGKDICDDDLINIGIQSGYHYNGFSKFFNVPIEEVIKNKKPKTVITSINAIFEEMLSNGNNFDSHIEKRIEVI